MSYAGSFAVDVNGRRKLRRIFVRPLAWRDLIQAAEYLEANADPGLAERLIDAFTDELGTLSKMPHIGTLCGFRSDEARNIRRWPITNFERWLIFYDPTGSRVEVVRLLHGAQDINSILD